jgi:hypothetical protein
VACTYGVTIDGFTVCFDPIFTPLVNDIVDPVENFFTSLLQSIENDVLTALNSVYTQLSAAVNSALNTITNALTQLGQTIYNALSDFVNNVVMPALHAVYTTLLNMFNTVSSSVESGFNTLRDFVGGVGTQILQGLNSVGSLLENDVENLTHYLDGVFASVTQYVTQGFNNIISGLEHIGEVVVQGFAGLFQPIIQGVNTFIQGFESFSTSLLSTVQTGIKELGAELYDALKTIAQDILAGLHDLVNAFTQGMQGLVQHFFNTITPRGRAEISSVLDRALELTGIVGATYVAGAVGTKIVENLHPLHSLHLQELFDRIVELFSVDKIPEKVVEGFFAFGLFKQLEYALNFELRPRLTELSTETRAVWYGYETVDELRQGLALEGFTPDLAEKYVKTIYRPMPPFILRYLVETGLASHDFLTRQLAMEGFDPSDVPYIAQIFDALELVPFQNQIKQVIYTYYKTGLIDDAQATQIMNVFQIPKPQQEWILKTATIDFENEQKTLLGNLTLDLLAKAELTVDQAIASLVKIGYRESRARLLANIRAVTAAPPPPKSTRAQLLQEALQNLGALGFA